MIHKKDDEQMPPQELLDDLQILSDGNKSGVQSPFREFTDDEKVLSHESKGCDQVLTQ